MIQPSIQIIDRYEVNKALKISVMPDWLEVELPEGVSVVPKAAILKNV